jgi:multisubunit Na+/H+ antiporter MnhG subunit
MDWSIFWIVGITMGVVILIIGFLLYLIEEDHPLVAIVLFIIIVASALGYISAHETHDDKVDCHEQSRTEHQVVTVCTVN